MKKTLPKRGRPPKGNHRLKADFLDIRLSAVEKQAFRDAADLAGLDLSAWVRERLRLLARKELESAGQAVAFLVPRSKKTAARLEHVIEARYVRPAQLFLRFADGLQGTWTFRQLDLDMTNMKLTTLRASAAGDSVEVKNKWGENVQLDSSSIRVLIDPTYAGEVEKTLNSLANQMGL